MIKLLLTIIIINILASGKIVYKGDVMSSYRTPFGLPVRWVGESGKHIENEFLFGLYEQMIKSSPDLNLTLNAYYGAARLRGFPNHIVDSVVEKKLSHDQLTAYYTYAFENRPDDVGLFDSFISGFKFKNETLHPRDYFYYKLLAKDYRGFLGLPVIYLLAAISFMIPLRITIDETDRSDQLLRVGKFLIRTKLSGELLYWRKVHAVRKDALLKACLLPLDLIVKFGAWFRYGSVDKMIKAYFQNNPDHPIIKHLDKK